MPQNNTETIPIQKICKSSVEHIRIIGYLADMTRIMYFQVYVPPVNSVTSAIRKVLYDIRTNKADSSNGKSRMRVNLVHKAVAQPMTAPISNESENMRQKSPTD